MTMLESVKTELVNSRVQGKRILFTVNMKDLGGNLLYVFPGSYNTETGECECRYQPQISGVPLAQDFKGKDGVCKNYPARKCDILGCEELDNLIKSMKDKVRKS